MLTEQKNTIRCWAEDDRPMEKLQFKGAENLSDAELLAIILNKGTRSKTAVDLARELLHRCQHNFNQLARLSVKDLMKIKGIGRVKAVTIVAAMELTRRRKDCGQLYEITANDSGQIGRYLQTRFRDYDREIFSIVYLNRANRVMNIEVISTGGMTSTTVDSRIILRRALEEHATGLILCHNHPSGNLQASDADLRLTRQLKEACRFLDIKLMDHIIVSAEGYLSFADEQMI